MNEHLYGKLELVHSLLMLHSTLTTTPQIKREAKNKQKGNFARWPLHCLPITAELTCSGLGSGPALRLLCLNLSSPASLLSPTSPTLLDHLTDRAELEMLPYQYLCDVTSRAPPPGPCSAWTPAARASPPGEATLGPASSPPAPAAPPARRKPATICES